MDQEQMQLLARRVMHLGMATTGLMETLIELTASSKDSAIYEALYDVENKLVPEISYVRGLISRAIANAISDAETRSWAEK